MPFITYTSHNLLILVLKFEVIIKSFNKEKGINKAHEGKKQSKKEK